MTARQEITVLALTLVAAVVALLGIVAGEANWSDALPYLFYAVGSACFLIGTLIVLARMAAS